MKMDIEEKYLEKIWTRINNGDDNRLMLSWDEQFAIMEILKQYHKEQLRIGGVVGRSEQLKCNHDLYRSGNYIKCRKKDCKYEILG